MNLDESQRKKVAGWLEEGLKLSEIQKRVNSEMGLNLTYMELRFLLDDLQLKPKEKEPPPTPPASIGKPPAPADSPAGMREMPHSGRPAEDEVDDLPDLDEGALPAAASKVSVTVDHLARPGALVSGNVTFSDGKTAQWYLDQTGRLGIVAKEQGYRPSQPDLMAFQTKLQGELAKLGY
jgi:hypothetical protein